MKTKNKAGRTAALFLVMVIALAGTGVAYALWSETLEVSGSVDTGELNWEFVSGSYLAKDLHFPPSDQHEATWDWTCDTGITNVSQLDKNVGYTTWILSDENGDTHPDTLTLTINNAYPCYYNEISIKVRNCGTIPLIQTEPILTYAGKEYALNAGTVVTTDDGVLEFRWGNNVGRQMEPGVEEFENSWEVHLLQPAVQGHTYTFTIEIVAVQWNEYTA